MALLMRQKWRRKPRKKPTSIEAYSKVFFTRFYEHPMDFCEARLLDPNTIELSIEHEGAAFIELMRVQIRNGKFTTEYSMTTDGPGATRLPPMYKGTIKATTRVDPG